MKIVSHPNWQYLLYKRGKYLKRTESNLHAPRHPAGWVGPSGRRTDVWRAAKSPADCLRLVPERAGTCRGDVDCRGQLSPNVTRAGVSPPMLWPSCPSERARAHHGASGRFSLSVHPRGWELRDDPVPALLVPGVGGLVWLRTGCWRASGRTPRESFLLEHSRWGTSTGREVTVKNNPWTLEFLVFKSHYWTFSFIPIDYSKFYCLEISSLNPSLVNWLIVYLFCYCE